MHRCLVWIWPQAHLHTKSPALSVLYSEIRSSHANMFQCISWYKQARPNRMLTFWHALTAEGMYAFQFWFLWSGSTVNTQRFSNLATPPPQSGTEANTCAAPPPPPSAVTTVLEGHANLFLHMQMRLPVHALWLGGGEAVLDRKTKSNEVAFISPSPNWMTRACI